MFCYISNVGNMGSKYVLAFDQGTSSSRSVLFDSSGLIVGMEQDEIAQNYPNSGWVEQSPEEIWQSQFQTAQRLLLSLSIKPEEIAGLGITNQRETVIVWDRLSGDPIYQAISWQDRRTAPLCNELNNSEYAEYIKDVTGLVIDAYFSGTKIRWILDNVSGARQQAENGELLFGTIDTWLIYKLTRGSLHITDYSNASRTMLFNIHTGEWDDKLLEILQIPRSVLPKVRNSSEIYGKTDLLLNTDIPIAGIAGDQQAALFGQLCHEKGTAKNTYGTGCFLLMNTGQEAVKSESGLITTIAWGIDGKLQYALEGSVFIAGAAIKWIRDGLKMIESADETEDIAKSLGSTEGVYVIPAFTGLGAPYWDMYARGGILGLTQATTYKHIVRATLEAIAYQTKDVLSAMEADAGIKLKGLRVDGGASVNNFLMQFQSDILNVNVIRPKVTETTALGAAMLAGLAVGFWTKEELKTQQMIDYEFSPEMIEDVSANLYNGWQKAIHRTRAWIDE